MSPQFRQVDFIGSTTLTIGTGCHPVDDGPRYLPSGGCPVPRRRVLWATVPRTLFRLSLATGNRLDFIGLGEKVRVGQIHKNHRFTPVLRNVLPGTAEQTQDIAHSKPISGEFHLH